MIATLTEVLLAIPTNTAPTDTILSLLIGAFIFALLSEVRDRIIAHRWAPTASLSPTEPATDNH